MKRIVIAGSRGFGDYPMLKGTLDRMLTEDEDDIELVSGHAKGADLLAERYAAEHGQVLNIQLQIRQVFHRAEQGVKDPGHRIVDIGQICRQRTGRSGKLIIQSHRRHTLNWHKGKDRNQ